jgi:hypothetical protein
MLHFFVSKKQIVFLENSKMLSGVICSDLKIVKKNIRFEMNALYRIENLVN